MSEARQLRPDCVRGGAQLLQRSKSSSDGEPDDMEGIWGRLRRLRLGVECQGRGTAAYSCRLSGPPGILRLLKFDRRAACDVLKLVESEHWRLAVVLAQECRTLKGTVALRRGLPRRRCRRGSDQLRVDGDDRHTAMWRWLLFKLLVVDRWCIHSAQLRSEPLVKSPDFDTCTAGTREIGAARLASGRGHAVACAVAPDASTPTTRPRR